MRTVSVRYGGEMVSARRSLRDMAPDLTSLYLARYIASRSPRRCTQQETANNTVKVLFHRVISIVPRFELGRISVVHNCNATISSATAKSKCMMQGNSIRRLRCSLTRISLTI